MEKEITTIVVVGSGLIGSSWAALFASKNLRVIATDTDPDTEGRLRRVVRDSWPALISLGMVVPGASPDTVEFTLDLETALKEADFVQESGPERLDLKQKLYEQLEKYTSDRAIIASSSSGFPSSSFASQSAERVLIGHPFNPPHLIPLVEVVPNPRTCPDVVERTVRFYKSLGKTPIVLNKEVKGFVANRIQAAVWKEAFSLVSEGVATTEDVDIAVSQGLGLRWALLGPYFNFHLGGGEGGMQHMLDHIGPAAEEWWSDFKPVSLDTETKSKLLDDWNRYSPTLNIPAAVKERDEVLVDLIKLKADHTALP